MPALRHTVVPNADRDAITSLKDASDPSVVIKLLRLRLFRTEKGKQYDERNERVRREIESFILLFVCAGQTSDGGSKMDGPVIMKYIFAECGAWRP